MQMWVIILNCRDEAGDNTGSVMHSLGDKVIPAFCRIDIQVGSQKDARLFFVEGNVRYE